MPNIKKYMDEKHSIKVKGKKYNVILDPDN
jgi:hypothetical protein